jgi:NADPH:quinone reductase-like Zn-dependent oxidoreductase
MRALAILRFGDRPSVQEVAIPSVDDAALIRVTFAGVNPVDDILIDQLTAASNFPFVVGLDFAGIVERVSPHRPDIKAGDRVFGIARAHGSYAQYTVVSSNLEGEALSRIPPGVSDDQAAALPVPGITALRSIEWLDVQAGQRVLVMGATGAVGGFAVQIARSRGAEVYATVFGDLDEAYRLGAQEAYDAKSSDVLAALRTAHPNGIDVILDLVNGPNTIQDDVNVLRKGGKLVSTRYAADQHWFSERGVTTFNISSKINPLASTDGLTRLGEMLANGRINARIHRRSELDDASSILQQLRTGALGGKTVIHIGHDSQ